MGGRIVKHTFSWLMLVIGLSFAVAAIWTPEHMGKATATAVICLLAAGLSAIDYTKDYRRVEK